MDASPELGLLRFLGEIPDPRSPHGRQHPLSAVLAPACCAILCGARSYAAIGQWAHDHDIELMHRLGFTRRPPKSGGIRKVLMAVSPAALEAALTGWAEALLGQVPAAAEGLPDAFALDGKSARGRFDGLGKAVHLLSLVAHRSGLTVAHAEVPSGGLDKTNEHKAALRLLAGLAFEGRLITGDAMSCRRDLSRRIRDGGGHYLRVVKENQPTLLADIRAALAPVPRGPFPPRQRRLWLEAMHTASTFEEGHGRRERRTLRATTALNGYLDWPGLGQVGRFNSVVDPDGKSTTETRYFISSVPREVVGADGLLRRSRGHRTIENKSHHVRDVSLGEDTSRIRKGSGPEVMAALRNLAIGPEPGHRPDAIDRGQ